ncbi:MAG: lysophospholipid acyltransferase family protein [Geminicoccaceae bacterium]
MAQSFVFHRGKAEARAQPRLSAFIAAAETGMLRMIWWLSKKLGPDRAGRLAAGIAGVTGPLLSRSSMLSANLAVALPGLPDSRRRSLVRLAWREIGRVMGEFPNLEQICVAEADERLEIVEHYDMEPIRRRERQAIFVSGHFANWELAAGCSRKARFPLSVLYSPQANGAVDAMVQHYREGLGVEMVPRKQAVRGIIKALQKGRNFGLLLDQRYDEGQDVPFFGHDTPSGIAAAQIAIRMKLDYVPVRIQRVKDAHFRITFMPSIDPDPGCGTPMEQAIDMTRRAYGLFEGWIREQPESWLCLKRRWPRNVYRSIGQDI